MIDGGVAIEQRSLFVIVGDQGKDRVCACCLMNVRRGDSARLRTCINYWQVRVFELVQLSCGAIKKKASS